MKPVILLAMLAACSSPVTEAPVDQPDAAPPIDDATTSLVLPTGDIGRVEDLPRCAPGVPAGATCKHLEVTGCRGIEAEPLGATLSILEPSAPLRGTVVHLKGGGGEGLETIGVPEFQSAGLRQVFVSWDADWEQTASLGIKTAGCRPATVIRWIFDELHGAQRELAFCGQGKSGGSGQLGYTLAHYGGGDYLDYVNELAGPPFARIDLGCDGDAPPTAELCGETVTMRLPDKVGGWENVPPPLTCGSTGVPAHELARWRDDSIAYGGTYTYARTRVEFFDCTSQAPAVAAMSKIYYDQIAAQDPTRTAYHCYSAADRCHGEGLGDGEPIAIQALIDGCVPRHR